MEKILHKIESKTTKHINNFIVNKINSWLIDEVDDLFYIKVEQPIDILHSKISLQIQMYCIYSNKK